MTADGAREEVRQVVGHLEVPLATSWDGVAGAHRALKVGTQPISSSFLMSAPCWITSSRQRYSAHSRAAGLPRAASSHVTKGSCGLASLSPSSRHRFSWLRETPLVFGRDSVSIVILRSSGASELRRFSALRSG